MYDTINPQPYTGGYGEPSISLEGRQENTVGQISKVFDTYGSGVKFDKRFTKDLHKYVSAFVNKNEDSVNFFGDALLGVYPVKFTNEDKSIWFDEVLDIDEVSIRKDLHSLECIDPSFRVSSDVTNQSYVWVLHNVLKSKHLSSKDQEAAAIEVLSMMHYKFLTSIMTHYFPYQADKSVALATYTSLSKKFSLKVHGSWAKLIRSRAESILERDSIHYDAIHKYREDQDIIKMINDIQGRIREVVKSMMEVFYQVLESDARIKATSSVIEMDGVSHVADKSSNYVQIRRYVHRVVTSKEDFIKDELQKITATTIHTVSPRHLEESLEFISDNYGVRRMEFLSVLIDKTLVHAMNYLRQNDIQLNDLPNVLSKLRSIYMSSKGTEPALIEVRELGDRVIKDAVRSKNPAALASARTATLIYIVLRGLTEKHYG